MRPTCCDVVGSDHNLFQCSVESFPEQLCELPQQLQEASTRKKEREIICTFQEENSNAILCHIVSLGTTAFQMVFIVCISFTDFAKITHTTFFLLDDSRFADQKNNLNFERKPTIISQCESH